MILNHMGQNASTSDSFHKRNGDRLIEEVSDFFQTSGDYEAIVDIIVLATAAEINMKLVIYQRDHEGNF